ncbi:hypothetical protein SAT01_39370 [Sinomonas atrocyanea]|nr:hypothetical protein SAT01_39370 [Sinomonas atrocyanea]
MARASTALRPGGRPRADGARLGGTEIADKLWRTNHRLVIDARALRARRRPHLPAPPTSRERTECADDRVILMAGPREGSSVRRNATGLGEAVGAITKPPLFRDLCPVKAPSSALLGKSE